MTPTPHTPQEQLVYSSVPWKIYRQDAGMGEHDYAVLLNDVFFCRTEHSQTAHEIINAIRSRPHPAPAQGTISKELALELCMDARKEAARQAREDLLNELESLIQDKWEFMFGVLPYNTEVSKDSLYKMINSLRQAQPQERE